MRSPTNVGEMDCHPNINTLDPNQKGLAVVFLEFVDIFVDKSKGQNNLRSKSSASKESLFHEEGFHIY